MAELSSEIIQEIMSRMPVKSLARSRCVSKQWCDYINDSYFEITHAKREAVSDPMLIVFHQFESLCPNSPCTLSFLEYNDEACTGTLEVRKKPHVMEFMCKSLIRGYRNVIVQGSCNGLLYSNKGEGDVKTLVVIHPLRKECYELPPIFIISNYSQSGLGYDESTNSFKMVFVVSSDPLHQPKNGLCAMVHVLGTDSWRKIPQVPSDPVTGEGVFANGCLHWLISYEYDYHHPTYLGIPVLTFDMASEEFGLINPPQQRPSGSVKEQLVDLHGEVGYVYRINNCRMEIWVLKERGWVKHCEFKPGPPILSGSMKVLGFWKENWKVLMTDKSKRMFVYNLKSDSLNEVDFVDSEGRATEIRMYQSSLFFTRYSIQKPKKNNLVDSDF